MGTPIEQEMIMPTPKIDPTLTAAFAERLEKGMDEARIEKVTRSLRDHLTEEIDNFACGLREDLSGYMADAVRSMAEDAVTALLAGNEQRMRAYLNADPSGWTGRGRDHPVIHGSLFETGAIELRKKIASAHRDLIEQERILDLEDQIASLVKQVNDRDAEINRLRQERNYA
jgi:hypothetical protein